MSVCKVIMMPGKSNSIRLDFARAMVAVLETRGFANLAMALARSVDEERMGTGNPAEVEALIHASKQALRADGHSQYGG